MKKFISIIMCAVLVVGSVAAFSGCAKTSSLKYEIALITDGGNINDGGYNQDAWSGVEDYAKSAKLNPVYYQPTLGEDETSLSIDTITSYIKQAVDKGAQYIVLPGEDFAVAAFEVAPTYPDVKFLLLDAMPHADGDNSMRAVPNVMSVSFDALQSGYLAGYTAVIQGNTKLGYLGSVKSDDSSAYGAGYVQGAALAADELKTPVVMSYADFDSPLLNFDYSFTIKPVYAKVSDSAKKCYNINVKDGYGTGTYQDGGNVTIYCDSYNAQGQKFDHWEAKSDTKGVKDKKVNLSTTKKTESNLIIGDCDATITAVYSDTDDKTSTVTVKNVDGTDYKVYTDAVTTKGDGIWVEAPAAQAGKTFDHWETSGAAEDIKDVNASATNVKVTDSATTLTPVYKDCQEPTFNLTVENGSGSGSYLAGDQVRVIADAPQNGYYFVKWSNIDAAGDATGIAMENEYYYDTTFEMVDRYSAIAESMIDDGATIMFAGGSTKQDSLFTAKDAFDMDIHVITSGRNEEDCFTCAKKEYGNMVKFALSDFKGGQPILADISNDGISMTFVGDEETKEGKALNDKYKAVYEALKNGTIKPIAVAPGADVRLSYASKCMSLNYMIKGTTVKAK